MRVAGAGALAHAATDLPGCPAVNQLNLHPAVTRIAHEQHYLHWMMLIICTVIFIGVFAVEPDSGEFSGVAGHLGEYYENRDH